MGHPGGEKYTERGTLLNGTLGQGEQQENDFLPRKGYKERSSQSTKLTDTNSDAGRDSLKPHKKKMKKAREEPDITFGTSPNLQTSKRLNLSIIRNLILHIFGRKTSEGSSFQVKARKNINNVTVCFIPSLYTDDFIENDSTSKNKGPAISMSDIPRVETLSFFFNNFSHLIQSIAPGSKETLFLSSYMLRHVPLSKREKKNMLSEDQEIKLTLDMLTLSKEEIFYYNFPVHSHFLDSSEKDFDQKWVETKNLGHDNVNIYSLDCEFCKAEADKVLTRISLINYENEVIIDSLVKPSEKITDYVTKYSGITESKLSGITKTLDDVQEEILKIISVNDILIGHSLDSDLKVLRLKHPNVIDTSLLYEHPRGPPSRPALKWLTQEFLGRVIQHGENGHSSVEDAQACLDLVKLKLARGMHFGRNFNEIELQRYLNWLPVEGNQIAASEKYPINSLIIDYAFPRGYLKKAYDPFSQYIRVRNDEEAVSSILENARGKDFIMLTLRELEFGRSLYPENDLCSDKTSEQSEEIRCDKDFYLRKINRKLEEIYSGLPESSAFIVCTPLGNKNKMIRLQRIKRECATLQKDEIWSSERQHELQRAVEHARQCMTFICVKKKKNAIYS